VTITTEEKKHAARIGDLRTAENLGRSNIADYDPNRFNLTAQQANRVAVLGEIAVGKFLGYKPLEVGPEVWAAFVESKDYGKYLGKEDWPGVEVRRANTTASPLPIREKDRGRGIAIIQPYVHYTQAVRLGPIRVHEDVELLGWADVDVDWHEGWRPNWAKDKNTRVCDRRSMDTYGVLV